MVFIGSSGQMRAMVIYRRRMDVRRAFQPSVVLIWTSILSLVVFFAFSSHYVTDYADGLEQLDLPMNLAFEDVETTLQTTFERNLHITSWIPEGHEESSTISWDARSNPFRGCKRIMQPGQTCTYSSQHEDYERSDAVIFRGRKLHDNYTWPTRRYPHQKWIFYEFEPPYKVSGLSAYKDTFNLTSTYAFDSDIPLNIQRRYYPLRRHHYIDYAANRTGLVAWFVSVCKSQSRREEYVKELQKYMQVDIYGECGPLDCGKKNATERNRCNERLLNHVYKFYLSFENSLCKDYVTEKLWKVKSYDVMSVVMGGVDYHNIMPPGSFIDAREFPNPKDLADYLIYLDKNDDEYNRMMNLRDSLKPVGKVDLSVTYECRLCKYLHDNYDKTEIFYDVAKYWSIQQQCVSQEEYFGLK